MNQSSVTIPVPSLEDLKRYGYGEGWHTGTCWDCGMRWDCQSKDGWRCRDCATKAFQADRAPLPASPAPLADSLVPAEPFCFVPPALMGSVLGWMDRTIGKLSHGHLAEHGRALRDELEKHAEPAYHQKEGK